MDSEDEDSPAGCVWEQLGLSTERPAALLPLRARAGIFQVPVAAQTQVEKSFVDHNQQSPPRWKLTDGPTLPRAV